MYKIKILMVLIAIVLSPSVLAGENWTATVKWMFVDNEEAKFFIDNAVVASPSGSSWKCGETVTIGSFDNPVSTSLKYSTVMEAYKSGATMRIGITITDGKCLLDYVRLNVKP